MSLQKSYPPIEALFILKRAYEVYLRQQFFRLVFTINTIFVISFFVFATSFGGQNGVLFLYLIIFEILLSVLVCLFQDHRNMTFLQEKTVGKFSINQEKKFQIKSPLKTSVFEPNAISSMQFDYEGYYGEKSYWERLFLRNHNFLFGTNNTITIHANDQSHRLTILLKNKQEKKYFQYLLQTAYEHGIQVVEFYRGQRSYGGKLLTYKEIQAFKAKYHQS